MGNFEFLRVQWPALYAEATLAERNAVADPRAACFYSRRALELALHWLFDAEARLRMPYNDDLSALLHEPTLRALVGGGLVAKMDLIRRQGNAAVHRAQPVTDQQSLPVLRDLFHVLFWLARTYSTDAARTPADGLSFDAGQVPRPLPAAVILQRREQLAAQAERYAAQDSELASARERNEALEAELAELRAQVAVAAAANAARPDTHDYDEAQTRNDLIDLQLREAGWALDQARDREFPVTGMPSESGNGFVDYVLWGNDGLPLGLIEAKRTSRSATAGQQQAKLYADCLQAAYGQRPVIFYSNGFSTWLWDDTDYPPRQVQGFYTQDELALLVSRRASRLPLATVMPSAEIVERHYQVRAIRRIDEAFERDRARDALVVMATGAGKTRTVIALVDQLMRANWAKRVLFLADRVALVNQAVGAFKAHLPEAATVNLVTEKDTEGRVYVSTYPTMMGLINDATGGNGERRFGPGYFDLIVIDEAHRSVYQKYQAIFQWFDALLVGLTATPKDEVDHNTYRLFHLEDGVPTDHYGLPEAVAEGYLVPPHAVSVPLLFPQQGIRYDDLPESEKEQWESLDWDDGDIPDEVSSYAVNQWLFNADTVDKVLEVLMTQGRRVAGGDRLGKTIVFAKNARHANFIAERFDASYPEYRGQFARVVTYQTDYAQSLIDDFAVKDKPPHVAVSVDMLDTGIDVPEVVNLVFFKQVRSRTKFWQMLGRGTRLCPDLFGPGQDKADFLVFDICRNFEFFAEHPDGVVASAPTPLSERLFTTRLELATALETTFGSVATATAGDGTVSEVGLKVDLMSTLREHVKAMNVDNVVVRPQRRWVEVYSAPAAWEPLSPDRAAEIGEHLSALPTAIRDDDEAAKRFDLLMMRLQLAVLASEPGVQRRRAQVQAIASALLEQTNVPAVRDQQALLDEVAGDEWWVDVTLPMLEFVRRRLRSLVKLLPKAIRSIIYTDFTDELGPVTPVVFPDLVPADFERFRAKARVYLRAHDDHVALQRLRRNLPLTPEDLLELERMLADAGADEADLQQARSHGLGLFVRSLVGLDRASATALLDTFVAGKAMSANQLDFVSLVVTQLTENGVMDPARLYESPFTELAPRGPESLFTSPEVDTLVSILRDVSSSAVVNVVA